MYINLFYVRVHAYVLYPVFTCLVHVYVHVKYDILVSYVLLPVHVQCMFYMYIFYFFTRYTCMLYLYTLNCFLVFFVFVHLFLFVFCYGTCGCIHLPVYVCFVWSPLQMSKMVQTPGWHAVVIFVCDLWPARLTFFSHLQACAVIPLQPLQHNVQGSPL